MRIRRTAIFTALFSVLGSITPRAAESPLAAVFTDQLPGHDATLSREIATQVAGAGYRVQFIGVATLTNSSALSTQKLDLLVLPGARSLPAVAAPAVENYLHQGGDLLALGLPAWEDALFELNARWLSRANFEAGIAAQKPEQILFDFAKADLGQWRRASDNPGTHTSHEIVASEGGNTLHVVIAKLTGWDTFMSPPLTNAFPPGHTLTCFRAKGGLRTKQLALEWTESDSSRWIATVELTTEWKNYALTPEAFKAWEPPPSRRGKQERFQPRNAARFVVGLAHSHTPQVGEQNDYWFAGLGTARSPFGEASLPDEIKSPHLESVSPGYLFFPIATNVVICEANGTSAFRAHWESATAGTTASPGLHPRPRGVGFNQYRQYRWEPLLEAHDAATDDYRGAVAALLVHVQPPFRGGVWATFTPSEAGFYRQPLVTNCLRQTLARMRRGVFLAEGGAEFFTTFPDQRFSVGARAANFGREAATNLSVSVEFCDEHEKSNRAVKQAKFALAPGAQHTVEEITQLQNNEENHVHVTLRAGDVVVDSLSHEIGIWQPKPKPEFIEARDGGFWLRGKPWEINGVNYMPSSGIGLANWQHFEHWVGRGAYDPEIIERDLRRMQAMNLNAVSVFIHHESLGAQHMLDFLRRCQAHGVRVNLSLRPGTPLDFRWNEIRELIEHYRLAQNDTVFAYDLAWEPRHEPSALKSDYVKPWSEWVQKRLGSVDAARKAWGVGEEFKFEMSDLKSLPSPPMKWFTQDGPWRKLVADYRLFLDDLLREKYAEARRLVKSIDPNHAVSFRMQHAGDPTFNWDAFLPYDFYGLADAVDIWESEAYGRIGDWERVKPGRFTADYARLCDARKPIVWAEMGHSVWNNQTMSPSVEQLDFQARYFHDFYRMMTESGADGIFFWWYPGGYRLNERSDFGIINPDGTDRPVTRIIRDEGGTFLKARKTGTKPDYWISVDRDRDARGLFGIYETVKDEYWKAIAAGKTPGLKWTKQPGQPATAP
ncbi:MAG: beta-galactosidase [Verrucomicrobia bacterium]|nr:beta-galactosidase [Verrucomicrobiota bacterium]